MDPHTAQHTVAGPDGERWPALGLGTWRLGESDARAGQEAALVERAIALGYSLIDTAEMYGEGGAERVVGQAITRALRSPGRAREQLTIVSKAYPHHASAAGLRKACEASLRRLQVDSIDLYLLHWRGDTPLSETIAGFEALRGRGLIRHWGVSNFDRTDMEELRAVPGGTRCASNQVYYSLSERGIEFGLLPWMRQHTMPLMAYCPIDGGALAGHTALAALARPLGLTAAQLALAWMLEQPGVVSIPKAGSEAHLLENWRCRDVALLPDTRQALAAMFPAPRRARRLAMR